MIVVGKILSFISPVATATAAILGVLTYIHTNNNNRREKEKAAVNQIRDTLKKLRDDSQFFLTTIASEEDYEKYYPFISISVEIASEIKRRLGNTAHKVALNDEQIKEIVFSSIVIGWEKSPVTVKVEKTIENIRKIRSSLPEPIAVIGETGDILATFIQHKFSPSLYFPSLLTIVDSLLTPKGLEDVVMDQTDWGVMHSLALEDKNSLETEITKLPSQLLEEVLSNFERHRKFIKCFCNLINSSTSVLLQFDDQQLLYLSQQTIPKNTKTELSYNIWSIHQLDVAFKQENINVRTGKNLLRLLKDNLINNKYEEVIKNNDLLDLIDKECK